MKIMQFKKIITLIIFFSSLNTLAYANFESEEKFVSDFVGEIHYFFGVGFKTGKRLIIMPMIETPIFALYEFNHIKSTHDYFNTRSRPLIFKVRFMFLKRGST